MSKTVITVFGAAILLLGSHSLAATWKMLFENEEQLHEWNSSGVKDHEGKRYVEHRITFKQEQVTDKGTRFKYMMLATAYSCTNKTETILAVSRFSADRKSVGKQILDKPITQQSSRYNYVQPILEEKCTGRK